jgi:hypothetical protein
MVVHDFDCECIAILPVETDPPLVIDEDAVLTRPVASKHLKAIGRRDSQIIHCDSAIQHAQLAEGYLLNIAR